MATVEAATQQMRERANNVEGDLGGLVDELRTTISSLVESVRSNAGSLESELQGIRAGLAEVREAQPEAPPEPEPVAEEPAEEPVAEEPVAEEAVAEEPVAEEETVVDEIPAEETPAEEPVVEEEPEVEVAEELPAEEEPAAEEEPVQEAVEPEPEAEPEVQEPTPTSSAPGDGTEGARLIALNMALNGTPREETSRYLEENFDLEDQDTILDEVYARVGGYTRRVAQEHDAAREAAFLQQLQLDPDPLGQEVLAAADHDRVDELLVLVHQARGDGLRGQLGPADAQILLRGVLQRPDLVRVESRPDREYTILSAPCRMDAKSCS